MLILALDLSTHTGIAIGEPGGKPRAWTEHLSVTDDGRQSSLRRLARKLRDHIEEHLKAGIPIDLVVYERPLSGAVIARMTKTQSFIGDMLQQFAGVVEGVTACYAIRAESVAVNTHRKLFLSNARVIRPKQAAMAQCRRLGWAFPGMDDNAADAMSVWFYACATYAPELAPQVGPLFVGVE